MEGCYYLGQLKQLCVLKVKGVVSNEGLRHVENLTELRQLDLRECDIDDVGAEALGHLRSLVKLDLG